MGENAERSQQTHHFLLKQYEKTKTTIAKEINRKNFLVRCRNLKLTPKFIQIKNKNFYFQKTESQNKYEKILNIFYFQLLSICISDCFSKLHSQQNIINKIKFELQKYYDSKFLTDFYTKQNNKYEDLFSKIKNKHRKKINNLMNKQHLPEIETKINNEWITNLTKINIPNHIKYILSLGPKFSVDEPIKQKHLENIITNIEAGIEQLDQDNKESIRNKIINIITNCKNKLNNNNKKIKCKINYFLNEAKSFLSNHKSLYILTADKSNKTVIMHKDEYNKKMLELLNNSSTYKRESHDLTKKIQTKINSTANNWLKKKLY